MVDNTEEHRQQLILEVERILDGLRDEDVAREPDWDPLHCVLPLEQCDGFMWMHRVEWEGSVIEVYRHGITRCYLHLDHDGRAYVYRGGEYEEIPAHIAVDLVFEDIEDMGCTRETPYSEEYRRQKYRKARKLRWTVIT